MAIINTYIPLNMLGNVNFSTLLYADNYFGNSSWFTAGYSNGTNDTFWGYNFTYDVYGSPLGGVVTGYSFFGNWSADLLVDVSGINIPTSWIRDAALTPSTADDNAIVRSALAGADTIYGSNYSDVLDGFSGNDTIYGYGGDDMLFGDAGNDTLNGGAGIDTAVFSGTADTFQWRNNPDGSFTVTDLRPSAPEGTDLVGNVEVLAFYSATSGGGTSVTSYDIADAFSWSNQIHTFDANGQSSTIASKTDEGLTFLTDYNLDHSDPWNMAVSTYDAQGRLGFVSIYRDMTLVTTYDAAGDQPWQLGVTGYDSQGRRDYVTIVNDDRSQLYTCYFYSGSNDYAVYSYDTFNNLTQAYVHHTDGTYDIIR